MSRAFCIPGVLFIFCALVLNLLVSISLPFLPALDITRTHYGSGAVGRSSQGLAEIRLGIWSSCFYDSHDDRTCLRTGHAYNITITNEDNSQVAVVEASWTRGLTVHPVAAAATLLAFILSLSTHITVTLIASLVSFLAAILTLIAFAIDIALFALVRHEMDKLGASTKTAPGFWMTFASIILLLLATCTVCCGRRRDRLSTATNTTAYPATTKSKLPFWKKVRPTKA